MSTLICIAAEQGPSRKAAKAALPAGATTQETLIVITQSYDTKGDIQLIDQKSSLGNGQERSSPMAAGRCDNNLFTLSCQSRVGQSIFILG
jgi:hypothetical protein